VCAGLGVLILGLWLYLASFEWFSRDDFAFLAHLQRHPWSWSDTFLPLELEGRFWWAYRPIGMHGFFYLAFSLFGLNPLPYVATSVVVHAATGGIVFRLARQLGSDPRIAAVTALLAISRAPSVADIPWASFFFYVAVNFFTVASVSVFLDFVRRGRRRDQLLSLAAFVLALGCCEVGVTLPALLLWVSLTDRGLALAELREKLTLALRRTAPHWILAAAYLYFRFELIAPVETNPLYGQSFGWHVPIHYGEQIVFLFAGVLPLAAALGIVGACGAFASVSARGRELLVSRTLPVVALCCGWILVVLSPYVLLPFAVPRFSSTIEVPVALLFGAFLAVVWQLLEGRRARVLELVLLCLVLVALPYTTLRERTREIWGAMPRQFRDVIDESHPELRVGSRIVVLYGGERLGTSGDLELFLKSTFSPLSFLETIHPGKQLTFATQDVGATPSREALCRTCLYFSFGRDLHFDPADAELVRALLLRGIGDPNYLLAARAARELALLDGVDAIPEIVQAARAAPAQGRSVIALALLLIDGDEAERAAVEFILPGRLQEARKNMRAKWR